MMLTRHCSNVLILK